jgi:hypothetical protein
MITPWADIENAQAATLFPNEASLLRLVTARVAEIVGTRPGGL